MVDTGLSLSAAHRPGDKIGRCPWLVSRTICTTHLDFRSASWSRILNRALLVPGNSLGEETDSSCPQKAYNLVRKKKKKQRECHNTRDLVLWCFFCSLHKPLQAQFAHFGCQPLWEGEWSCYDPHLSCKKTKGHRIRNV